MKDLKVQLKGNMVELEQRLDAVLDNLKTKLNEESVCVPGEPNSMVSRKVRMKPHFNGKTSWTNHLLQFDVATNNEKARCRDPEGHITRWIERLREFYFDVEHRAPFEQSQDTLKYLDTCNAQKDSEQVIKDMSK